MIDAKSIGVVLPVYKSKHLLNRTLAKIPDYVDEVVIVDDCCTLHTLDMAENKKIILDRKYFVISHTKNMGVGGAFKSGASHLLSRNVDIIVKLDSDDQVNPNDIASLAAPLIALGEVYSKGNRFLNFRNLQEMPITRLFGNWMLGFLSAISSGYYSVRDPSNGFLAIRATTLKKLNLDEISNRFFFETDVIFHLRKHDIPVVEVPHLCTYGEEESNLKVLKEAPFFLRKLSSNFISRIAFQYFAKGFSVGGLCLSLGMLLTMLGISILGAYYISSILYYIPATPGQVAMGLLPSLVGMTLILIFFYIDISTEPKCSKQH